MQRKSIVTLMCLIVLGVGYTAFAQQPAQPARPAAAAQGAPAAAQAPRPPAQRPPLFFREEWQQTPANDEHPVTQQSVANPNLEYKPYGTTSKELLLTGTATNPQNPTHVWNGMCTTNCAMTLRDKTNMVDLSGQAKVKWVVKTSGFHKVQPIVKLADGTWLIGDSADASITDWKETEVYFADLKWVKLDIARVVTTGPFLTEKPDLTKVEEFGWADLMASSGHGQGGWADVARIELYGKPVPRGAAAPGGDQEQQLTSQLRLMVSVRRHRRARNGAAGAFSVYRAERRKGERRETRRADMSQRFVRLAIFLMTFIVTANAQTPAPAAAPAPPYGTSITTDAAKRAATAAIAEARKNNWFMAIAIVDPAGNLVYFEKMDGTQTGSVNVSIGKARSAALFKRPTKAFQDIVAAGGVGLRILALEGAVPVDGGIPIIAEGKVIGAIGASGGTSEQDGQTAQAGAGTIK